MGEPIVLTRREEVRRIIENMSRDMKLGKVVTLEVSEDIVEYAVDEAVKRGLSIVDAYERDNTIVLIIEKRFG